MIEFFDVIWVWDGTIRPPGSKMIVCISPEDGEYLRINTRSSFKPCVKIEKEPYHPFLDHDSHVECNLLEFDDFTIEDEINRGGIVGKIHESYKEVIFQELMQSKSVSAADKDRLRALFGLD